MTAAGLRVPRSTIAHSLTDAHDAVAELGLPFIVRPAFTLGGTGGGVVRTEADIERIVGGGLTASPIGQVLLEESVLGLGRVRARGDARPHRQRGHRVLDREPRSDGRAHRRQRLRGAPADAHRQAVPGPARPGDRRDPRRRGGDRGLQRPVRGQLGHRRDRHHRDEPARVALERSGQQGHRVPDRQDRRPAGGRLHAPGDPQRHHPGHAGQLRARDRLLRGQVAAVRVREVPRRRGRADHPHEVGRRGDGARAHVQAGVRQGAALARARHRRPISPEDDEALLDAARDARRRALRPPARGAAPRDRCG